MQQFFVRSTGEDCFGRTVLKFVLDRCFWLATVTKLISRYVSRSERAWKFTMFHQSLLHFVYLPYNELACLIILPCCFFTRPLHWTYLAVFSHASSTEPTVLYCWNRSPYLPTSLSLTCLLHSCSQHVLARFDTHLNVLRLDSRNENQLSNTRANHTGNTSSRLAISND